MRRPLAILAALVAFASIATLAAAPNAAADGDAYCESGEICLATYYASEGWLLWTEASDATYTWRWYDNPGGPLFYVSNNSQWAQNRGNFCSVTIYPTAGINWGKSSTLPVGDNVWRPFPVTSTQNTTRNDAEHHDFCATGAGVLDW